MDEIVEGGRGSRGEGRKGNIELPEAGGEGRSKKLEMVERDDMHKGLS